MDDDNNMDENVGKVLLLTIELVEKDKIIEMIKILLIKKIKNYL